MRRVWEWFKGLHWMTQVSVIFFSVIAFAVIVGYTLLLYEDSRQPRLADFSKNELKALLINETGLEIVDITLDKRKTSVTVSYFEDDVFSEDNTVYIAARDAAAIMPILFGLRATERVKVVELGTFLDEQGNSSIEPSVAITLTKNTARDIAWEEVSPENRTDLIEVASELYINPVIRTELTDTKLLNAIIMQLSTN